MKVLQRIVNLDTRPEDGGILAGSLHFLICSYEAFVHAPALQATTKFPWPVLLRAGHEHLPAPFAALLQERKKTLSAFGVQFAHHIVNQQDRRCAVDGGDVLGLGHLEGDGDGAFLTFTGIIAGGLIIQQECEFITVRSEDSGAHCSFAISHPH